MLMLLYLLAMCCMHADARHERRSKRQKCLQRRMDGRWLATAQGCYLTHGLQTCSSSIACSASLRCWDNFQITTFPSSKNNRERWVQHSVKEHQCYAGYSAWPMNLILFAHRIRNWRPHLKLTETPLLETLPRLPEPVVCRFSLPTENLDPTIHGELSFLKNNGLLQHFEPFFPRLIH